MAAQPQMIIFDYDFSPYATKIRMLLALSGLPYKRCDVPPVLPRPQLESLGITYRRIPVLAIGKDVYCDTSLIVARILELQGAQGRLHQHPAAAAFERWADWAFSAGHVLIPPQMLTPDWIKDRETIFPIFARSDFSQLRPSGLGTFTSIMSTVENDFLASGYSFIGGRNEPSTADVHVAWALEVYLVKLGFQKQAGFGEADFPRTHAWLKRLPFVQPETLGADITKNTILESQYSAESIPNDPNDPLQAFINKDVDIENADTQPGKHPQRGQLISSSIHEVIIELPNGIRVHFPHAGYFVKPT